MDIGSGKSKNKFEGKSWAKGGGILLNSRNMIIILLDGTMLLREITLVLGWDALAEEFPFRQFL